MRDVGKQYQPDNAFKAAARLHQSKYRAEVLQVDFKDYGNRLVDVDTKALLNYYDKLNARQSLVQRFSSYSRKRDADMLRSEHIPFNLLALLDTNRAVAATIISDAWNIDCVDIQSIKIEHAPSPKEDYLNDGTAFDTYMKVILRNGQSCGIGIEVKYTEQAYPIGQNEAINVQNHDSLYWQTARKAECFKNPDDESFGSDELRQIWRNHLLGLKMIQVGDIDVFYSITLFPNGNNHFHHVIPEYIARLKSEAKQYVSGCTFEQFISAIQGSPEFEEWKAWLSRRYLATER